MYKVRVLVTKEVVEVEIEAQYCLVDGNNNLVFQNRTLTLAEPLAMIAASRWISVKRVL